MTPESNLRRMLDCYVERQMRAAHTPGIALALTDQHRLLHLANLGQADVASALPVKVDTLFEIGSITKSFTAVALLQLQEAGRVHLTAPVTDYLPWFHVQSAHAPITLHHLLCHTAGIIGGTDFTAEARHEVWALRDTIAATPPGTRFYYSNVGYKALGLVLEMVAGRPYGEIVRRAILEPLGMAATHPTITHETRRRMAVGYEPWYDDRPFHPSHPLAPATWLETGTADGSIASTAADMAVYLRCLMNRGRGLLNEDGFRTMTQRLIRQPDETPDAYYGYGLSLREECGRTLIGHSGGMVGYYSEMLADLDLGLGVVVMANAPGETADLARCALRLFGAAQRGEEPPPPRNPAPLENAADYAGAFQGVDRAFTVVAKADRPLLRSDGDEILLETSGDDTFHLLHPRWDRFLLRFVRRDGRVVEAVHGGDCFVRAGETVPPSPDYPRQWDAYPGHYRTHNPWYSNYRIVLRRGHLILILPAGEEQPLSPLSDGSFCVGEIDYSPERIRFDTLLDGTASRAVLSCCPYYRTFTP